MLVLTRKTGQAIYLGDNVKIFVQEIRGGQVRIGIEAPNNIKVFREEIYLQILEESRLALEQTLRHELPENLDQTLAKFFTPLESSTIQVEGGLIGFSKWENYEVTPAMLPFLWLESIDKPELKFLILSITNFKKQLYPKLNIPSQMYCLVTPQDHFLDSTINLKAPLIINQDKATQFVIDDDDFDIKLSIAELLARVAI